MKMNLNGRNLLVRCALAASCVVAFTCAPAARAQQTDPNSAGSSASTQSQTTQSTPTHVQPGQTAAAASKQQTMQERNGGSNERVLWVLPNFLSVEEDSYKGPNTAGQKFKLVTRSSFDPAEFVDSLFA